MSTGSDASAGRARIASVSPKPSRLGISTSVTTRSGRPRPARASASSPSTADADVVPGPLEDRPLQLAHRQRVVDHEDARAPPGARRPRLTAAAGRSRPARGAAAARLDERAGSRTRTTEPSALDARARDELAARETRAELLDRDVALAEQRVDPAARAGRPTPRRTTGASAVAGAGGAEHASARPAERHDVTADPERRAALEPDLAPRADVDDRDRRVGGQRVALGRRPATSTHGTTASVIGTASVNVVPRAGLARGRHVAAQRLDAVADRVQADAAARRRR